MTCKFNGKTVRVGLEVLSFGEIGGLKKLGYFIPLNRKGCTFNARVDEHGNCHHVVICDAQGNPLPRRVCTKGAATRRVKVK